MLKSLWLQFDENYFESLSPQSAEALDFVLEDVLGNPGTRP